MRSRDPVFDGLGPVRPPRELRERVLNAARAARADRTETMHWIDCAWESRALRLAWALALALALAGHLGVDLAAHHAARRFFPPAPTADPVTASEWSPALQGEGLP